MAAEWVDSTISDICLRVYSGGTPRSTIPAYFTGGTIPWLKTKEVRYERIYSTESKITELGLANSSAKIVPVNSVIVAMYGDGETAGRVGINKIPLTTNQACCNLLVNSSLADYRFVYYSLRLRYRDLVDLKNGGGQQNLNAQLIKSFKISLPPMSVQCEISDFLESLDDRIESLSKTNITMESMARAIFKSWFVDFDPVRAKAEGREPDGMDADTAALFPSEFQKSELGAIPKGWSIESIGDLTLRVSMGPFGSNIKTDNFVEKGVPIIRGKNLRDGFIDDDFVFLLDGKADELRTANACAGDIVITHRGTLGQVGRIPEGSRFPRYVVSQSQMVLTVDSRRATSLFVYYYLTSTAGLNQLLANTSQVGVPAIARPTMSVKAIKLPMSERMELIHAFESLTSALASRVNMNSTSIRTLADLRDTLLPRLISGKLRVPEAEAMLTRV